LIGTADIKAFLKTVEYGSIINFEVSGIGFELFIDTKYPVTWPRLSCTTVTEFPSISDGRDILALVVDWKNSYNLCDIISFIPKFIESYKLNEDIGNFHLMTPMSLNIWEDKPGISWFYCIEIDPLDNDICINRIIVITHSYFLLLDPDQKNPKIGYIIFWASLFTLSALKKSRENEEIVIFEWNEQIGPNIQMFKSPVIKSIIDLIKENTNKLDSMTKSLSGPTDQIEKD
jgi:hypothetical protein